MCVLWLHRTPRCGLGNTKFAAKQILLLISGSLCVGEALDSTEAGPAGQRLANRMFSAADFGAWIFNVASSVAVIFANKLLMGGGGFGFDFAVTLSGLHFLSAAILTQLIATCGFLKPSKSTMPWRERFSYALLSCTAIVALNISLLVNSIGFYQLAKLCNIPFVALLEALLYGRRFSLPVLLSMTAVIVGVGVVTVSDIAINQIGLVFAAASVAAAGSQQLLCRHLQTTLGISSHEMLHYTAAPMAVLLLAAGPPLDALVTRGRTILDFEFSNASVSVLAATCALAVGVNLSQFMCLGRFTALGYQVLGHAKTVCVLLGGALLFHEPVTPQGSAGILLAVAGMVSYGLLAQREAQAGKEKAGDEAAAPLLHATHSSGSLRSTASLGGVLSYSPMRCELPLM